MGALDRDGMLRGIHPFGPEPDMEPNPPPTPAGLRGLPGGANPPMNCSRPVPPPPGGKAGRAAYLRSVELVREWVREGGEVGEPGTPSVSP